MTDGDRLPCRAVNEILTLQATSASAKGHPSSYRSSPLLLETVLCSTRSAQPYLTSTSVPPEPRRGSSPDILTCCLGRWQNATEAFRDSDHDFDILVYRTYSLTGSHSLSRR